jgi:hypothetical protein
LRISGNNASVAGSYYDNGNYVILVRPGGGTKTYGPFNWNFSFSFSPNSELFFCAGMDPVTGQVLVYVNDEKYSVTNGQITPVFTTRENKYAAFVADIEWNNFLLYTDTMTVNVALGMETAILPDGMAFYWTMDNNGKYLNIVDRRYGPFDYAADFSDDLTIRWVLCEGGNIQLISVKR